MPPSRRVFCVLSARSLPYARHAISSLLSRSLDPLSLCLITDSESDKQAICDFISETNIPDQHTWSVHAQAEADERAEDLLARHPNLSQFRLGHPCWRKLTDPMLFSRPGEEMIILDPDLYFPNHFSFEPTPGLGRVLLMWQPPSCLLPHEVVMSAYHAQIKLAHHVDIGVAQMMNNVDLEWFEWVIGHLGGKDIPRIMHVEAIVWAAFAMRMGGGYLDPMHWHCWRYRQWKRIALRLGVRGLTLLRLEDFRSVKCFHASGIAKWWVPESLDRAIFPPPRSITGSSPPKPFEELTLDQYKSYQHLKEIVRKLGYYKMIKPGL